MLAAYRKIELMAYLVFSFGVVQNFRAFSRPFRATVEKNYLHQFDVEWSKLFRTGRNLKIGSGLARWATLIVKAPHLLPILKMNYLQFFRCHYLIKNLNTINVVGNVNDISGHMYLHGSSPKMFFKNLVH